MKTILVADDEFDMTRVLRSILEREGYRVETCTDGRAALEQIKDAKLDLVLMDVMMPLLSGFEVLQAMRRTEGLEDVPVVLMSSIPPGVKREDYPWQGFLYKPFSLEALTKMVERLIGKAAAESRTD